MAKDDCGCGHSLQNHGPTGGGYTHGGACGSCNCGKFERPTGKELGMMNAIEYLTRSIQNLASQIEASRKP